MNKKRSDTHSTLIEYVCMYHKSVLNILRMFVWLFDFKIGPLYKHLFNKYEQFQFKYPLSTHSK